MLHVGLDLSRTRLDVHAMDEAGASVAVTTAAPDAGGLASLAYRLGEFGQPVTAVIVVPPKSWRVPYAASRLRAVIS